MSGQAERETKHPKGIRRKSLRLAALGAGASLCAAAALAPAAFASEPCCGILGVDRARGTVTAFEYASGNIFRFTVKNKTVLAGLSPCQAFDAKLAGVKDGQAFAAGLGAARASGKVTPGEPCCQMTSAPGAAGRVLGVQSHAKFDGVEILLTELSRSGGDLVTATCLYCNNGRERVDLAADLRARAQGKAKLLDTENRIEYRVARVGGPQGEAMMSDHGPGLKLQPGQSARSWIKFAAPASGKATVVWPGASEPFADVPIAK